MAFPTKEQRAAAEQAKLDNQNENLKQDSDKEIEIKSRYTDPNYGAIRKMGRNVSRGEDTATKFYSVSKNTVLYADNDCYIEFKNYEYVTDNEFDIDFIKRSPLFGRDIFEGQYPKHILEMFRQRRQDLHDFPEERSSILRG